MTPLGPITFVATFLAHTNLLGKKGSKRSNVINFALYYPTSSNKWVLSVYLVLWQNSPSSITKPQYFWTNTQLHSGESTDTLQEGNSEKCSFLTVIWLNSVMLDSANSCICENWTICEKLEENIHELKILNCFSGIQRCHHWTFP